MGGITPKWIFQFQFAYLPHFLVVLEGFFKGDMVALTGRPCKLSYLRQLLFLGGGLKSRISLKSPGGFDTFVFLLRKSKQE